MKNISDNPIKSFYENKAAMIGIFAVIIAASLWGVDQVLIRPNLFHLENIAMIVFLEHLIGFIIMSTFCWYGISEIKKLDLKDWGSFFWVSLFGGAIGTMAIVKALILVQFNKIAIVALLQKLQPVFAIIVAIIILGEKPTKKFYLWAVVALIGSYFVTFGFGTPDLTIGNNVFMAALYALLAAFAFGSSTSFGKHALQKVSFRTGAYIRFGMTTVIMFAILLLTNAFSFFSKVVLKDIGFFVLIAFTSGALAMFLYYFGLKRITASVSTFCELAYPVTAIVLDYIINKATLSMGQWLGALLIIVSVVMITRVGVKASEIKETI
jgi:drug/metabolite transporter (DMT)-like permease